MPTQVRLLRTPTPHRRALRSPCAGVTLTSTAQRSSLTTFTSSPAALNNTCCAQQQSEASLCVSLTPSHNWPRPDRGLTAAARSVAAACRLAPLSEGRIEADGTLQCSYHGTTP